MNDDTRDIALDARSSAASAHHRLDSINGQIARGAQATEQLREDTTAGFAKLTEDFATANLLQLTELAKTNVAVATLAATVGTSIKVAAAVVSAALAIVSGVSVYLLTHMHSQPSTPPASIAGEK